MKNKILLVEDERDIRDLMAIVFSSNFELEVATNGVEALEKIKQNNYHVVLTDMNLPELSGPGLIKEVKSLKPLQKTILLTGDSSVTLKQAQDLGATGFFKKPFDFKLLIKYIQEI